MSGNTFTWFGGSGFGNVGTNWSPAGPPGPGDVAIVGAGTLQVDDAQFNSNTLILNGGTFQAYNTTETVSSSSFDANSTLVAGGGTAAVAFDIFGGFLNYGTIEAVDNPVTVAISADINAGSTIFGTLVNDGLIAVQNGATLDVTGGAGNTFQGGDVDLKRASALITAADSGSNFTLDNTSTLGLDSVSSGVSVNFSGTADLLALMNSSALDSTIDISGFGSGDTLDIGTADVGTLVYQYQGFGGSGFGGSGTPILTIIGTNGGTVLSDPFSGSNGNLVGKTSGTFVAGMLPTGVEAAGPFEIVKASNGDTLLEPLPPSTWSWTNADPSDLNSPNNFELIGGPGNQSDTTIITAGTINGQPNSGDTVFFNNATIAFGLDKNISGNTIFLTGTSEMSFVGDQTGYTIVSNGTTNSQNGFSYQNPTLDQASLISNHSTVLPDSPTLNFAGYNVNEGTIISNGIVGSSLTLNVTQDGTAPGYFINYGDLEADTGNSMTIAVTGTSELFNANLIYANGGSILIKASSAGIAGGYAPMLGGVALIGDGGTIELNAGYPSGTGGSNPSFVFYDGDAGDTLKIDQLAQFGGRILGFQQGDTIDLGEALNVGSIVVKSDGRLLLENPGGTVLASLVLSTGAYNPGTFAVTSTVAGTLVADGFTLTTGGDGNTLLTTNVVESVWNNSSTIWQTASAWSTGVVPGSTSTVVIGINATGGADGTTSPFVITTGTTAVVVNSLSEINPNATLQITSATTVGTSSNQYALQQIAGEIEVTGGNTLTVTDLKQDSPGATLQVDAGAVLDITGHDNLGFANSGTISTNTVVNGTAVANGNTIGLFVTGTATVDGGMIDGGPVLLHGTSVVSTGGLISIGQDGGGTPAAMTVEDGGTVIDTSAALSSDPTSFGSLTLTGSGTTWDDAGDPTDTLNTRGYMLVGNDNESANRPSPSPSGTAQLLVENGATLNEALYARIGNSPDSAGGATITSGGVWNIGTSSAGGSLNVGYSGSGTLDINGGTVNVLAGTGTFTSNGTLVTTGQGMGIAHNAGSDGTVVVEGGGVLNDIASSASIGGMGVGQFGTGELDILDGGTVAITDGGISAGSSLGGVGTITVGGDGAIGVASSGPPSALLTTSGGGMTLGRFGTGTLVVNAGGTVAVSGGGIGVGQSAGAYGFAEINGGLVTDSTNGLTVGNAGTGTLDLNSGTISLTGGGLTVGNSAGASDLFAMFGGLVTSSTNGMIVGNLAGATGTLDLQGGTISLAGGMQEGSAATSTGLITVGNGLLSGSGLTVGNSGAGTLDVTGGGLVSLGSGFLGIGNNTGGTGTVQVSGAGAELTVTGFSVGGAGVGTLTVGLDGLVVTNGGTTQGSQVGGISGGSGSLVISGGTVSETGAFFNVGGTNSSGTLLIDDGGQLTTSNVIPPYGFNYFSAGVISASGTGTAAATVNDGTWTANGSLTVGSSGNGSLDINGGGVVNAGTNVVIVGSGSVGSGTLSVESGGTLLAGGLWIGDLSAFPATGVAGTMTVGTGGYVAISGSDDGVEIGAGFETPTSGTLIIAGGTMSEGGADEFLTVGGFAASGTLLIDDGGLLTTSNGFRGTEINSDSFLTNGAAVIIDGGTWLDNDSGQLQVGFDFEASLAITDGLLQVGTGGLSVGGAITGGTMTVGSGGTFTALSGVTVEGTLTVGTGGLVVTNSGTQGFQIGGSVVVNGGTVSETGAFFDVGGTLLIDDGGQLTTSNTSVVVGEYSTTTSVSAGIISASGTGSGAATVNSDGTWTANGSLTVGSSGNGSLDINSGVVNAGTNLVTVGSGSIGSGTLSVETGGTLLAGGLWISNLSVYPGTAVAGTVTVGTGGDVAISGSNEGVEVGAGFGNTSGSLIIAGGTMSETGESLTVGEYDASGTLLIDDGGLLTTSGGSAGSMINSSLGTAAVTINDGTWLDNDSGALTVSFDDNASLAITDGLLQVGTGGVEIGLIENAAGTITVGSGGTFTALSTLVVGDNGAGTLEINGGTVSVGSITAGAANFLPYYTGQGLITVGDGSLTGTGLTVGSAGTGTLEVTAGGTVSLGSGLLTVGSNPDGSGTVQVSGTGAGLTAAGFTVGGSGVGTLVVQTGGVVTDTGNTTFEVGQNTGGSGDVDVDGGMLAAGSSGVVLGDAAGSSGLVTVEDGGTLSADNFTIGGSGAGTLTIGDGGVVDQTGDFAFLIAGDSGSTGTVTVDGGTLDVGSNDVVLGNASPTSGILTVENGSTLSAGGFTIGNDGNGTLTVATGGVVVQTAGGAFEVGQNSGGNGTVSVTGGTLDLGSANVVVGNVQGGSGIVTIGSLGTLSAGSFTIGNAGPGTLTVGSGGVVTQTGGGTFEIGQNTDGSGTVTVDGGTLDVGNASFVIGNVSDSTGSLTVVDDGTLSAGGFTVGSGGDGSLTVESGGVVTDTGSNPIEIGENAGGSGTVTLDGGTLDVGSVNIILGNVSNSTGSLIVETGGVLLADSVTVGSGGIGTLSVGLGGTVDVVGVTVGSGSAIDLSGGALDALTTVTVNGSGTIEGYGTLDASVSLGAGTSEIVSSGGTLEIVGSVSGNGTLDLGSGSTLQLDASPASSPTVAFGAGAPETLILGSPGTGFANAITGFVDGDRIEFGAGETITAASFISASTIELTTNTGTYELTNVATGPGATPSLLIGTDATTGDIYVQATAPQTYTWTGAGNTTFANAANWYDVTDSSPASVPPGAVDTAQFLATGGTVTGTGTVAVLQFGSGSQWSLESGAALTAESGITVGNGELAVDGGASIASNGSVDIISGTGGLGASVTVSGTHAAWGSAGNLIIGNAGLGNLAIESDGTVISNAGTIANTAGASGASVNVTGAGSDWQVGGTLVVGNAGFGSLALSQGATVAAGGLDLGAAFGGDGVVSVVGTSTVLNLTGSLTVGDQAAGELSILGGATVSALDVTIGNASALSSGNVDVEGPGSELLIGTGGLLNIGLAGGGSGVLTVGTGAILNFNGTIVESGHASFNNNGGVVDPDAVEFTSAANSGAGLNEYSLYVGNINAVQVDSGTGTWDTPMILTGTSVADATNNIDTNGDTGAWQLSQGGTLIINANTIDAGQAIVFEDATDTLVIGQLVNGGSPGVSGVIPTIAVGAENLLAAGGFEAAILGYQAGDQIRFDNMTVASDSIVGGNTLELFGAGDTLLGSLTFFNKAGTKPLGPTGMAAAAAQIAAAPCFAAGTRIATERGEVAVEAIGVGERVRVLLGDGLAEVIWVGWREVDCVRHAQPRKVWPVRVAAGAFGAGRPHSDLFLSPDHAVYVGEVLIPVKHLINGSTIAQVPVARVTYCHLELAEHDVLLAEGLPAESFLDMRDGSNYANRPGPVRLYPDFSVRMWEAFGCARLIVTGPELAAARELVGRFAAEREAA
jgi:T5SS/PEP-CTERM-associated repeat protein